MPPGDFETECLRIPLSSIKSRYKSSLKRISLLEKQNAQLKVSLRKANDDIKSGWCCAR